jgi:hypothetical protein
MFMRPEEFNGIENQDLKLKFSSFCIVWTRWLSQQFFRIYWSRLDVTPKIEIVPHDWFHKCENLQEFLTLEVFVSRVQTELFNPSLP